MDKEVYLWIAFFIIVIAAALYYRYYYSAQINLSLSFGQNAISSVYPYQEAVIPVTILNNGSTGVSGMELGIEQNGNLTTIYKIYIPAGKEDTFDFNFTPTTNGTYAFTAVIDPDKLYNIADRQSTQSTFVLHVNATEAPEAYAELPSSGLVSGNLTQSSAIGLVASTYMFYNYSVDKLAVSRVFGLNAFLYPLFSVIDPYLKYVDTANGAYKNGNEVYSIWLKGALTPGIIFVGAEGKGLPVSNYTIENHTVTYINFGNETTLCSWYEGGWIKLLGTGGNTTCLAILNMSNSLKLNSGAPLSSSLYARVHAPYDDVIANDTGFSGNRVTAGTLSIIPEGNFLVYKTITTNDIGSNTCFGLVDQINGTYYCSTYVFPLYPGNQTSFSLIQTTAYVNSYNLSVLSIVNTSKILNQVPINIALLRSYNITGQSLQFLNGIKNTCGFNTLRFNCTNVTYSNGTVGFTLMNNFTKPIKLESVACFWNVSSIRFGMINGTINPKNSRVVTTPCYEGANVITGIPLNLHLGLDLNYSVANVTNSTYGEAFIV